MKDKPILADIKKKPHPFQIKQKIFNFLPLYGYIYRYRGFLGGSAGKKSVCQFRKHRRCGFDCWVGKT